MRYTLNVSKNAQDAPISSDPYQGLTRVLVTDCGSTTTKALLFERIECEGAGFECAGAGWRQTARGEAPTTVEEPVADVTVGAMNAFAEVQELSGHRILKDGVDGSEAPFLSRADCAESDAGIDIYLSTSSAGGGLQMVVAGVVKDITAQSAERAALGAGAIVLDCLSADDGREESQRVKQVRHLRPDIVLITGGIDGGAKSHVIEVAEVLLAASPRPRFGETLRLPIIYAGNRDAAGEVVELLQLLGDVKVVDNVRPTLDRENITPAREAIHDFFLHHVMSHSPGYGKLLGWSPKPIIPTPAAVGEMILKYAVKHSQQVLCADIGGATTDLFSVVWEGTVEPTRRGIKDEPDSVSQRSAESAIFNRTVSANLGMSYSIANVMLEAGVENISRWLPYQISNNDVRDRLRNKMIRPTTIPQSLEDLWLEQAVCREALRLSLRHHRSLVVGLKGVQKKRGISEMFSQQKAGDGLLSLREIDLVIGSGGVLSHAPHRMQAALMMLDGFGLEGLTEIAVDSIFMLPHLGVFASVAPDAALEILERDCLVRICHALVARYPLGINYEDLATVFVDGKEIGKVKQNRISRVDLPLGHEIRLEVQPVNRVVDIGAGAGKALKKNIRANKYGLILDGRNRPINFNSDLKERIKQQEQILREMLI